MLGLSSSYFAFKGKNVYDSVKSVFDLGFEAVELGAAHEPEPDVWKTVRRIRRDFPDKDFTLHGVFPPPEKRTWFNASTGLTKQNLEVIENFFKAAQIVEAKVVSIHPGFREELSWKPHSEPMSHPQSQKAIPKERAWAGVIEVVDRCVALAEETGCVFAIENIPDIAIPLVYSKEDFNKMFEMFPKLKMMFDLGHALYDGLLQDFLNAFNDRIGQIHLHLSRSKEITPKVDEHMPITGLEQLKPLQNVKQFKQIPIIFEHWPKTAEADILAEKKMVEEFEENF